MFHIGREEYHRMPNVVMQILRIVQEVKAEVARKKIPKEPK